MKVEPGLYEHYKGGKYLVLHVAKEEATLSDVVVYAHLDDGVIWTRPVASWTQLIVWPDGHPRPRFRKLADGDPQKR